MAQFKNSTLTYEGVGMITQSHAENDRLRFTRLAIGDWVFDDGKPVQDPADKRRLALESERLTVPVSDIEIHKESGTAIVSGHLDNKTIEPGDAFRITEIGAFACNADGVEKLYAYAWAPLARADLLPDKTTPVIGTDVRVIVAVSDVPNIVANIDITYLLTNEQLKAIVDNYSMQIGDAKAHFEQRVSDEYAKAGVETAKAEAAKEEAHDARDAAIAAQSAVESALALAEAARDDAQGSANDAAGHAAAAQAALDSMETDIETAHADMADLRDEVKAAAKSAKAAKETAREAASNAASAATSANKAKEDLLAQAEGVKADIADAKASLQTETANALDKYNKLKGDYDAVQARLASQDNAKIAIGKLTLAAADWQPLDTPEDGFAFFLDKKFSGAAGGQFPYIEVAADSRDAAAAAGQFAAETSKNSLRFLAAEQPTADINVTAVLLGTHALKAVTPPTQDGTLTYTGEEQSPVWTAYNASEITISGETSGTDAKRYVAVFTLADNCKWSDNTFADKREPWHIGKAENSVAPDKAAVSVVVGASDTVEVTRSGSGAIGATSADEAIATATASGTTVTITGVAAGTTTVTLGVRETKNYNAATTDIAVTVTA